MASNLQHPQETYNQYSGWIKIYKKAINEEWNKQWEEHEKKSLEVHLENPAAKIQRRDPVLILRFRIGHTTITHEYIFKKENPRANDVCKTPINIKHLLLHYKKYQDIRKKLKFKQSLEELLNNTKNCIKVPKRIESKI